ncbi:GNAT family N-acetyltransferase [bacterium]|nr:GNAT family N-acetyltransferase [bacterium]
MLNPCDLPVHAVEADGVLISTDRSLLDLDMIFSFLSSAYWCEGITREQVERQLGASLTFGLYVDGEQRGFCRVLTDLTRFAYLADVLVPDQYQGQGYGRRLVRAAMDHPELRDVNRWLLATRDAHGVYGPCGFEPLGKPEMWMECKQPKDERRWR